MDKLQAKDYDEANSHVTDWLEGPSGVSASHELAMDKFLASISGQAPSDILQEAGGRFPYRYLIDTFSHGVGSLRMGMSEADSALDVNCRLHGVDNLYVSDGSFMPTSGGVNPSLTIAANGLRVGNHLVRELGS